MVGLGYTFQVNISVCETGQRAEPSSLIAYILADISHRRRLFDRKDLRKPGFQFGGCVGNLETLMQACARRASTCVSLTTISPVHDNPCSPETALHCWARGRRSVSISYKNYKSRRLDPAS
jgi:hypothetical protein